MTGKRPIGIPVYKVTNAKGLVINGVEYESLNKAVLGSKVCYTRIKTIHRELMKTRLSTLEREVSITHMMTFSLPKESK